MRPSRLQEAQGAMSSPHRCQCPELGRLCPACVADADAGRGLPRSRLTAVHDALVRRYQQGERLRILAQDYGVTPRAIHYYLHSRGLWQSRGGSNQYRKRQEVPA